MNKKVNHILCGKSLENALKRNKNPETASELKITPPKTRILIAKRFILRKGTAFAF